MSRDYKGRSGSSSGKKSNPLLAGIFAGYALGVMSAIGVWVYIDRAPSPLLSPEDRAAEEARNGHAAESVKTGSRPSDQKQTGKTVETEKPRFDFYKILPATEESGDGQSSSRGQSVPHREPGQDAATGRYFLQAGSFQHAGEADNQKAKLAIMGIEAIVESVDLPGKGIWHRLRIGPYRTVSEINQARMALQQNGIQTSLMKVQEER